MQVCERVATGILNFKLKEIPVLRACDTLQVNGDAKVMLSTHVIDMLWATKQGYEHLVEVLLDWSILKTLESGSFRFSGREIVRSDDFSITKIDEKKEPIQYDARGRNLTNMSMEQEISQLRSLSVQLLNRVNKLQSVYTVAKLEDLKYANKLILEATHLVNEAGRRGRKAGRLCSLALTRWART